MKEKHSVFVAAALVGLILLTGTHLAGRGGPVQATWSSGSSDATAESSELPHSFPPPPAPPPPPPRHCELAVEASPWARHCQLLRRVCLDQSTFILYDDEYQELDGRIAGALPQLRLSSNKVYLWPWRGREGEAAAAAAEEADNQTQATAASQQAAALQQAAASQQAAARSAEGAFPGDGDDVFDAGREEGGPGGRPGERRRAYEVQADYHRHLEAPRLRPATAEEPAPYLQYPTFSSCTVPVVLAATWRNNFWHVMDNCAVWSAMVRRTPWRAHIKPLALTPDGLGLSLMEAQLLPALAPLAAQSLADASARLPRGYGPGSVVGEQQQGGAPLSFEGGEQRCFQNMFFCGERISTAGSARAAAGGATLEKGVPRELFAWGREVVQLMQQRQVQQQRQQQQQQQHPDDPGGGGVSRDSSSRGGSSRDRRDSSSSGSGGSTGVGGRQLKVVFMRRESQGRQLLNAEELVERCNSWQLRLPGGQGTVTAACRQVSTPDLSAGVEVAQEADLVIGMHGANMANSWFMRPGTSTIEIMPYEWVTHPGALSLSDFNAGDVTSQLLWWVLIVCDPSLSAPGPEEAQSSGLKKWWPRDRSARLPWPALEAVLAEVVAAGGDMQRYLADWKRPGKHRFNVGPTGVLAQGKVACPTAPRAPS